MRSLAIVPRNYSDIFDSGFDKIRREFFNNFFSDRNYVSNVVKTGSYPKIDILEKSDKLEVQAAVPGLKKEDVSINYENETLSISSNKSFSEEKNDGDYVWKELHKSSFTRSIYLSETDYDVNSISAEMKDGILVGCKDYPCNSFLQFRFKGGKLNLYIFRRSNDIVWGIPYNVIQFSYLLEMMCGWLDVEMGYVSEYITSLHVYFGNSESQDVTTKLIQEVDPIDIYTDSNDRTRKAVNTTDARMSKEKFEGMFSSFYYLENLLKDDYSEITKNNFRLFSKTLNEHWKNVMEVILLHHAYKAKDDVLVFELFENISDEYKPFIKEFYKRIREVN